jgi:hypothetical protein
MAYTTGVTEQHDVKSYQARAGAAFAPYTILSKGTDSDEVINATSGASWPSGISGNGSENNAATYVEDDPVIVNYAGIVFLKLGGTVARDGAIISGAAGVGMPLKSATDVFVIGHAMKSGVSGDIIPVMINRYFITDDSSTI